jgi:excisionase family DNA binding protein
VTLRTVDEAAADLAVSPLTVRDWIWRRKIGVHRIGRCVRIPDHEIARIVESGYAPARSQGAGA